MVENMGDFNRVWLEDTGFDSLVRVHWLEEKDIEDGLTLTERFINKLRNLKSEVKRWEQKKKTSLRHKLTEIDEALKPLHSLMAIHCSHVEVREQIHALELKKKKILQIRETSWCLKNRATWIREGDKNTKFFHRFSSHRMKLNTILQIVDGEGNFFNKQSGITALAASNFQQAYKRMDLEDADSQVWVVNEYPKMFNEEDNLELFKVIMVEELTHAIKSMKENKSPGPNGWTMEFFVHFIDISQEDLLNMIEESRTKGTIHPHLNFTYITLIPKKMEVATYDDYCPISLCNLTYKIISNIITIRIKDSLSKFISL
eukprot:PITA_26199